MSGLTSCATALPKVQALRVLSTALLNPDKAWRHRLSKQLDQLPSDEPSRPTWGRLRAALSQEQLEALQHEYVRLFGPSGACPLELAFHLSDNPFEQVKQMSEMAGFYRAFGVEVHGARRPDHLSVGLEFLAYLAVKVAYAKARRLTEPLEITRNAAESFLHEFLLPGTRRWLGRLNQSGPCEFYRCIGELLQAVLPLDTVPTITA